MRRSQAGQATIEWSALAAARSLLPRARSRSRSRGPTPGASGSASCMASCARSTAAARSATRSTSPTASELAALVRAHAPNVVYERSSAALPIDFRRCRETGAPTAPTPRARSIARAAGLPVTAFTRVVDRRRDGGALYLQYWFYFPESFTGGIGRIVRRAMAGLPPRRLGGLPGAGLARRRRHRTRDRARRVRERAGATLPAGCAPFGRQPRRAAGRSAARGARHARRRSSRSCRSSASAAPGTTRSRSRRRGKRTSTRAPESASS